jgi:hypothetical protein
MSHQVQSPVGEGGGATEGGSDTSSNDAGGAAGQKEYLPGVPASASTPAESNAHPTKPQKRAWSDQYLPKNDAAGRCHDVVTNRQIIELVARKEALRHVEMAWRAQQRLVRRCLGLRFLRGDLESAVTPDSFESPAGKGSDAAEPDDK